MTRVEFDDGVYQSWDAPPWQRMCSTPTAPTAMQIPPTELAESLRTKLVTTDQRLKSSHVADVPPIPVVIELTSDVFDATQPSRVG
jgi:hypothetical protein